MILAEGYEYYPVRCETEAGCLFHIYCSGREDYLINDGELLTSFADIDALLEFTTEKELTPVLIGELTVYDFIYIRKYSNSDGVGLVPRDALNAWDLFDDVCDSLKITYGTYKNLSDSNRGLHQNLVFGSGVFNEEPLPNWECDSEEALKEIMGHGLKLYRKHNKNWGQSKA